MMILIQILSQHVGLFSLFGRVWTMARVLVSRRAITVRLVLGRLFFLFFLFLIFHGQGATRANLPKATIRLVLIFQSSDFHPRCHGRKCLCAQTIACPAMQRNTCVRSPEGSANRSRSKNTFAPSSSICKFGNLISRTTQNRRFGVFWPGARAHGTNLLLESTSREKFSARTFANNTRPKISDENKPRSIAAIVFFVSKQFRLCYFSFIFVLFCQKLYFFKSKKSS